MTEELKATDQMAWVRATNSIFNRATGGCKQKFDI
ncbi:hypothetical protein [Fumia xinanensis]|uniref:Uncharacterized protein n=1 Tax=Fumia xinanensis TaxID=2763659 RepID=A0A926E1A4_9FIRM|nr:hypothetical protein [Fumia xinanensis]PWL45271.1 MAG: hypothetical protein DBY45_04260 [Clostridiales bacterium]